MLAQLTCRGQRSDYLARYIIHARLDTEERVPVVSINPSI